MKKYSSVGCGLIATMSILLACEAEPPEPIAEPPPPALVQDARGLAGLLEAEASEQVSRQIEIALLEERGVAAGVTIRTRLMPLIEARLTALQAVDMSTPEGTQLRDAAIRGYEARRDGLREQAVRLEAVDADGLEYFDAVQMERRGVQMLAEVGGAIQAILQPEATPPSR